MPGQNINNCADDIFKTILMYENNCILPQISLSDGRNVLMNSNPALIQMMAWCGAGDKLSELMMAKFTDAYIFHLAWMFKPFVPKPNDQMIQMYFVRKKCLYAGYNGEVYQNQALGHLHSKWWPLQWRHNGRDDVSDNQPHDSLVNRLFRRKSKKTRKLRVTGLCEGIHRSPVILVTKGQQREKCLHLMTWSWIPVSYMYGISTWRVIFSIQLLIFSWNWLTSLPRNDSKTEYQPHYVPKPRKSLVG